ncbi:MAG: potassium-transporting ATPase subunit KdpA [Thermoplasmata archaeon]
MSIDWTALAEIGLVLAVGLGLGPPLGSYLARVYLHRPAFGDRFFGPMERLLYRLLGVTPSDGMSAREYLGGLLLVNLLVGAWLWILLLLQGHLFPMQPGFVPMSWDLALHTAASFTTNTDFTHFTPETSLTEGAALLGILVPLFLSAASGLAVAAAFSRSFVRKDGTLGNVYVDLIRSVTRVLLPIATLAAVVYLFLGVPDTLTSFVMAHPPGAAAYPIFLGPVAPWQAIELLGTNGGGYYGANAASALATPNVLTALVGTALMLLLPFAVPFAFGHMVRRPGESYPIVGTMLAVFLIALGLFLFWEASGNLSAAGVRFAYPVDGNFQLTSIYTNTGATNLTIGSTTPLAQMVLFFGMFTQSTPGGVGTGFATLLVNLLIAVFLAGLMVGRTPEYLGKRIGLVQVRWAAFILIIHPVLILLPTAITFAGGFAAFPAGSLPALCTQGYCGTAHQFSAILYEFTSEAANNGSGYGYGADGTLYFNLVGAAVMLLGRFLPIVGIFMIAEGLSVQSIQPAGSGTLRTQSLTFAIYLALILIIVTALLFLPVIALGPLGQIGG